MIKLNHISKTFYTSEGQFRALKDVSLEIEDGQCVVIGAENGSGQSVLMNIIAGLEEADSGNVDLDGQRAGLVFQEAETQILGETPREDIAFGPKNLGWKKQDVEAAVTAALEKTGLNSKADFPARFMSGGEKRRLAVACMIAMNLPVIILDEPFANLDFGGVKQLNQLIKQLKKEGKTIIILTHEIEKCLGLADRFIVLFRSEKVFDGSPADGIKENLEDWNIRNPMVSYKNIEDLVW